MKIISLKQSMQRVTVQAGQMFIPSEGDNVQQLVARTDQEFNVAPG